MQMAEKMVFALPPDSFRRFSFCVPRFLPSSHLSIPLKTAIHWFRRDFRLTDNTALNAAAEAAEKVVPVYILSDWKRHHHWTGPNRQEFICGCLRALAGNLEAIGGRLIIRSGPADRELEKLLIDTKAEAIFFNRDPDPFGRAMEARVEAMAKQHGAVATACKDVALHERDEVLTQTGAPYRVYSPYGRAWDKLAKPAVGPRLKKLATPAGVASLPLPDLSHWDLQSTGARLIEAGEKAARARLDGFVSNQPDEGTAQRYKATRDFPAGTTTSRFSQDLRWGLLSVRDIYHRCVELRDNAKTPAARDSVEKYLREIAWRDFYMQILYHYPEVLDTEFNPAMRGMPWRSPADEPEAFARWQEGRTGFPLVDAGMRQLAAGGYMHNRVRMIVSMFLTKDLHIGWRDGEAHFNRLLVDGEIANNNGGWQWSAGTGADAAPYFRIQNPWTQGLKCDPKAEYIKAYVPELRDLPAHRLLEPPNLGRLSKDYPPPMVNHTEERDRTLAMFREHLAHVKDHPVHQEVPGEENF